MRRNRRAVARGGVGIHDDQIVRPRRSTEENAAVFIVDFVFGRLHHSKVLLCHRDHRRIQLDGVHQRVRIVRLIGSLRAAASQPDHGHPPDLVIPKPGRVKILRVLEMAAERIGQQHSGLC